MMLIHAGSSPGMSTAVREGLFGKGVKEQRGGAWWVWHYAFPLAWWGLTIYMTPRNTDSFFFFFLSLRVPTATFSSVFLLLYYYYFFCL